ncbi:MAG TPA: CPBP family intramembrane glutamic endopeptidase, partial [Candidatus Limnocylindrales bacterium]|nr:CPBP family intramembrane glutamic endopeptidase [Candidatus Limnocylindrales bacterium]
RGRHPRTRGDSPLTVNDIAAAQPGSPTTANTRPVLYLAWAIVLLLTVPEIVLRAFMRVDTSWMLLARIGLLAVSCALTFVWPLVRPLRGMLVVFLVIYVVEAWLFLTAIPQSQIYHDVVGGDPNVAFFGERLMRIAAVLVMLAVVLRMGFRRRDLFLAVGDLRATAEPTRLKIPHRPEPWTTFGRTYAIISVGLLLFFLIPALKPSLAGFSVGLLLFAAVCAAMNSFAEEFLYRSALIPQVLPLFGKGATLMLVPAWFGLAHYFGVPNGFTGVLLAGIGGWFFAKSMIETRGIAWAWFLHFLADFTVYLLLLLSGGL